MAEMTQYYHYNWTAFGHLNSFIAFYYGVEEIVTFYFNSY